MDIDTKHPALMSFITGVDISKFNLSTATTIIFNEQRKYTSTELDLIVRKAN